MNSSGLSKQQHLTLLTILQGYPHVQSAYLFGSRAMGSFKENSDIDIVLTGEALTLTDIANILVQIEQTTIPFKVDVLIKHKIKNTALIEHINQFAVKWF